jgi:hypothetical protein
MLGMSSDDQICSPLKNAFGTDEEDEEAEEAEEDEEESEENDVSMHHPRKRNIVSSDEDDDMDGDRAAGDEDEESDEETLSDDDRVSDADAESMKSFVKQHPFGSLKILVSKAILPKEIRDDEFSWAAAKAFYAKDKRDDDYCTYLLRALRKYEFMHCSIANIKTDLNDESVAAIAVLISDGVLSLVITALYSF